MAESGLLSAGGPLPLTQAVPGNLSTGPCGPGGAPYGRTEYGRSRRSRGRSPGVVKGLINVKPLGTLYGDYGRPNAYEYGYGCIKYRI